MVVVMMVVKVMMMVAVMVMNAMMMVVVKVMMMVVMKVMMMVVVVVEIRLERVRPPGDYSLQAESGSAVGCVCLL